MKTTLGLTVVVAAVVSAAAFFGGMKYQQSRNPSRAAFPGQPAGRRNGAGGQWFMMKGGAGTGRVTGEILTLDDDGITVRMPDGTGKIIIITQNTAFIKSETGSRSNLAKGERIAVFGTTNPDGSVTATDIQINPMLSRATDSADRK